MFEMKPEYYIGIDMIDQEHKQLFDYASEAYELLQEEFTPDKYDKIDAILEKLRDYTVKQFSDEEVNLKILTQKYIQNNTDNVSGIYVFLQNSYLFSPEEQAAIIQDAKQFFKEDRMIQTFSDILEHTRNIAVGMPYVDLKMQDPKGKEVSLSDYVG